MLGEKGGTPVCGIIGYTGENNAEEILLQGLRALEYRGYDSAGTTVFDKSGKPVTVKCRGRVENLAQKAAKKEISGTCGIGHTRWATHGAPEEKNAHPHASRSLTLVHNGIIDNCVELKKELENDGYGFVSDTDTECAAHLIDREYRRLSSPVKAIYSALDRLRGSYALAIIFYDRPDEIYAVRKDSPLIVAVNPDGGYVASDIPALLPHGRDFIRPKEGKVCVVRKTSAVTVDRDGTEYEETPERFDLDVSSAQKNGYPHFMLKEICEEPTAVANAVAPRINEKGLPDFSRHGLRFRYLLRFGDPRGTCRTVPYRKTFGRSDGCFRCFRIPLRPSRHIRKNACRSHFPVGRNSRHACGTSSCKAERRKDVGNCQRCRFGGRP